VILIDTSIWIDFFRHTQASLNDRLIELLENRLAVGLSTVFGELIQGARSEDEEKTILEFWNNILKVNEDTLFIEAGKLSNRYKLYSKGVGLIDCHLLAAAKLHNLSLWTLDRRLFDAYEKIVK
jgi:predicted nucleic acid-binding protein